jgi:hypothetical protein
MSPVCPALASTRTGELPDHWLDFLLVLTLATFDHIEGSTPLRRVGPVRAAGFGLRAQVEVTEAPSLTGLSFVSVNLPS